MAVDTKTATVGMLLIAVVAMAGWVGFLYVNPITKTKTEEDEETIYLPTQVLRDYKSGLPDDKNTAPDTSLILYNETGDPVEITLAQILDYVEKWEETDPDTSGNEDKESWWEKRLKPLTVTDSSGIPITGVDITELLRVFDCNFAGELEFVSKDPSEDKLKMDIIDITNTFDNEDDDEDNIILGIAADKKWLRNSPIADDAGDFVLIGQELTYPDEGNNITEIVEYKCYDLANITVTKNWTIRVNVYNNDYSLNQTLELDFLNMTTNPSLPQTYEYSNNAWFNYNRTYIGRNISTIIDYTEAKNTNYKINVTFSPGDSQPANKTKRKVYSYSDYFNWTDVEIGLANNGTNIVGNHVDLVNGSVPMAKTDLIMSIIFKEKMRTEYYPSFWGGGVANSPWEEFYSVGYPCYKFVVPGGARSRYFNGVIGINVVILGPRS